MESFQGSVVSSSMTESHILLKKTGYKISGGEYFYTVPKSIHYTMKNIYEHLKYHGEISFVDNMDYKHLFDVLYSQEVPRHGGKREAIDRDIKGDTGLMNRIIRNGGLLAYALTLEKAINE